MTFGGSVRVLSAAVLAAAVAFTSGCASSPPPVSDKVQAAYEAGRTLKPAPTRSAVPVNFALGTQAVFFGDSWTAGLFLDNPEDGLAHLAANGLGLDAEVIGGSGTGYLNPGKDGLGTYAQRFAKLPVSDARLLIIQGSVNDFGKNLLELGPAFDRTITAAKQKFPKAQIVILGPSTAVVPVTPVLARVDDILAERSQNAGLSYISPYGEQWITEANYAQIMDRANTHPTKAGHVYLASKLEDALNSRKAR